MLKQVSNTGFLIDGITTNVKEKLRRKSRRYTQRKNTTYVKLNNERVMKEKQEIKSQFDELKEQHQKDKQKEQKKQNEMTLETIAKTLGNCDRIKINHVPDKDQQIKDFKIQLQKEKDTSKILLKYNVEMK